MLWIIIKVLGQNKYRSPLKKNQQCFLDTYEIVISVHSRITDFLLGHLILSISRELIFYILSGIRSLLMSGSHFFKFQEILIFSPGGTSE